MHTGHENASGREANGERTEQGLRLVVAMFATLDVDAGCDHGTSRGARKLEQGLRRKQLFLGLFDRRLLARGFGPVLEPDDIGPRGFQFQADARALDSNVECAAAVFMGRALTLLRGGGASMAREAKPKGKQEECAHAAVTSSLRKPCDRRPTSRRRRSKGGPSDPTAML